MADHQHVRRLARSGHAAWLVACRRAWKVEHRVSDDPDHLIQLISDRLDPPPHSRLHCQPGGALQRQPGREDTLDDLVLNLVGHAVLLLGDGHVPQVGL